MSQKERLLEHFKTVGNINPLEAWQQLGIYRLSSTVLELRKDGHEIETDLTEVKNRFGEKCRVANYIYKG